MRKPPSSFARDLENLGTMCWSQIDGVDAMHLLSTEQLDIAILDRMLPQLDGLSIVRRARAAGIEVPVLLLTALGRIEDRVTGLEAGGDDYLVKPFAFSELGCAGQCTGSAKAIAPRNELGSKRKSR